MTKDVMVFCDLLEFRFFSATAVLCQGTAGVETASNTTIERHRIDKKLVPTI